MPKLTDNRIDSARYQRGQAMLVSIIFFLAISVSLMLGSVSPSLREDGIVKNYVMSRQSYATAESGVEDALYRLRHGMQLSTTEVLSVATSSIATTTVSDSGYNEKEVVSVGHKSNRVRTARANVEVGTGATFSYGVHTGQGGFLMQNNSKVNGNIYSNGPVVGENSNIVRGSVVSAGPSGSVIGIRSTSSMYAHAIDDSIIEGDAYYTTITESTVEGTSYPGSADQPVVPLPISDATISVWETAAENGGTVSSPCPYKITADVSLGPVKINCDLEISNNPDIILNGTVWVKGNITIKNSPTFQVNPSLGNQSVAIIADNPDNRSTASKIALENSAGFNGSGAAGSYVMVISQNSSAEQGGATVAINLKNGAQGDLLLYAAHGTVLIENSSSLKEVTAYRVHLKNFAEVAYSSGLANLLFTGGPSGTWLIKEWEETE